MIRALSAAATGMDAQQLRMDITANNLANVNTTGFKKDSPHFEDLIYQTMRLPGGRTQQGTTVPTGLQVGHGTRLSSISKSFSQGSMVQTDNQFDLAIEGSGFFQIQLPNGQVAYTRDGSFRTDAEGRLVTSAGDPLEPNMSIPPETKQITISREGVVTAFRANATEGTEIGRIQLVDFPNSAGLENLGHNYLKQSEASGEPVIGNPGENGLGTISEGFLEQSNVKVVEEMIALITTQRAYELNSKVIQTVDQMLQNATRIR
jgi:flagellar basal-body rod protein FlgG